MTFHWSNKSGKKKMSAPMKPQVLQVIYCILIAFHVVLCDDEFEGLRTLTVEHSLGSDTNSVYTKRGTIVVQSIKNSKAKFSQSAALSAEERETLKNLAESNDIYRVRIPVKTGGREDEDYVTTYTLACAVYESGLSDHLWIQFDQSGEVLGVSIATYPSQCEGIQVDNADLTTWNTTVDVSSTSQGPAPDTQSYIEKLKREEQERTKGQQGDNRSFFGKYWMYIVPFVLIMMLASSADPNAQGGGGR